MNTAETQSKQDSSNALNARFVALAESVSDTLSKYGINIQPYRPDKSLNFSGLDLDSQSNILKHFEIYSEVLIDTHRSETLQESKVLVWNMLKRLNFFPTDDILSKIKDNHIVEIYNSQNIQIFRNLSFFKVCSYSLDEILCIPWWKLYHREDKISQEIFKFGSQVLSGEINHSVCPEIPTHILTEIASTSNYKMEVDIDFLSSLEGFDQSRAALVLETAHLI